jgi:hypothetical protein
MTNKREFPMIPKVVPRFVRKMLAHGRPVKIVETMKKRCFLFTEGVDVSETLESNEYPNRAFDLMSRTNPSEASHFKLHCQI